MNIEMPFLFDELGKSAPGKPRIGSDFSLTIHPTQIRVSRELLAALGRPERVKLAMVPLLNAFVLWTDPDGYELQYERGYFNAADVVTDIAALLNYDRRKQYCRLLNGETRNGKSCIFRLEDVSIVDQQPRSGK